MGRRDARPGCQPSSIFADITSHRVGGREVAVEATSLDGLERERAWARIVAAAPGYAKYALQTDLEIPVVRLTRTKV